ncbi:uncharacterized protein LOC124709058 [Schistocerca piceifrons]|uniref:uncharacterized protein LOC124709058 n=1 Tax=Schistocerca piceifrons TaxID=274613 RepID=UPI001F5FD396|nr:uncharacterized protein LOC124709058 [Schistocerca piceifrons]
MVQTLTTLLAAVLQWLPGSGFHPAGDPSALAGGDGCGNGKYLGVNPLVFKVGVDRCCSLAEVAREKDHEKQRKAKRSQFSHQSWQSNWSLCLRTAHSLQNKQRAMAATEEQRPRRSFCYAQDGRFHQPLLGGSFPGLALKPSRLALQAKQQQPTDVCRRRTRPLSTAHLTSPHLVFCWRSAERRDSEVARGVRMAPDGGSIRPQRHAAASWTPPRSSSLRQKVLVK